MQAFTRRMTICAVAVVLVLTAGLLYLLLPMPKSADVATPKSDASPEQVVEAYIAALNAHDCGTATALAAPYFIDSAKRWCRDVSSLTAVVVEGTEPVPAREVGLSSGAQAAEVLTTFDLHWRPLHGDPMMPNGPVDFWSYILERDSPTAPWRIRDEGDAP